MNAASASFYILAGLTWLSACMAMMLRGLVRCALALALTFAGIGALYLNLGAQFLGLAQLLVYVGAVAVLIVFVILLTRGGDETAPQPSQRALPLTGSLVALAVLAVLGWAVLHSSAARLPEGPMPQTSIRGLGFVLMQSYVFPLEVIGLLLTSALIGAVIVAMKEKPGSR